MDSNPSPLWSLVTLSMLTSFSCLLFGD